MEQLLEMAKKAADQAEVYSLHETSDVIRFENGRLKEIESRVQDGISLRIIKDGKLGFSYTKNLINREGLLRNALDSVRGGVEVSFDLPRTADPYPVNSYEAAIEGLSNGRIVDECRRVCEILGSRTPGQINMGASRHVSEIRIINSRGADLSSLSSFYSSGAEILYPGSYAAISRQLVDKTFKETSDEDIEFMVGLFNPSQKEVQPKGGAMNVLFLPEALYALVWRLQSATSGRNIYQKVSPVIAKKGEKILDEKLNLYDDPLSDRMPGARAFDDEGTACQLLPIINRGVLENFYYDLFYAGKLKVSPTGHGYKSSMWGGETVSFRPSPGLEHLYMSPGKKSFKDLMTLMDRGIIVAGAMGAHSGNILNGDYSIGLSPGLYVDGGEVVGQVKDAMVAGNVFETLRHIIEMEDALHPAYAGVFPAILFENVSVATKG